MIEFRGVSKWYGPVLGVLGFNLKIEPGITALLGQTGAGKSTLMHLMTGLARPSTGTVTVLGKEPFANAGLATRLGYCPDSEAMPDHLACKQFLIRQAQAGGLGRWATNRADELLRTVGMGYAAERPLKACSKGMRQRIKLANSLIHEPEVLLLDEPMNGLDPPGRAEFSALLLDYAKPGRTVLVSSHILHEVEHLTDMVVLVNNGRLIASGPVGSIRDKLVGQPRTYRIETVDCAAVATALAPVPGVVSLSFLSDGLRVATQDTPALLATLSECVLEGRARLTGFEPIEADLEAVYASLVER